MSNFSYPSRISAPFDPFAWREWIQELRTTDIPQATGVLRDATGAMCCLGIRCNLVDFCGWSEYGNEGEWYWNGHDRAIPFGMAGDLGYVDQTVFANMNDMLDEYGNHVWSFADIADSAEVQVP